MHSEIWMLTWQVVSLGMVSTFVFLGLLMICLKLMRAWIGRDNSGKGE